MPGEVSRLAASEHIDMAVLIGGNHVLTVLTLRKRFLPISFMVLPAAIRRMT